MIADFAARIMEEPTELSHWVTLADWLEDNGDLPLANAIRDSKCGGPAEAENKAADYRVVTYFCDTLNRVQYKVEEKVSRRSFWGKITEEWEGMRAHFDTAEKALEYLRRHIANKRAAAEFKSRVVAVL